MADEASQKAITTSTISSSGATSTPNASTPIQPTPQATAALNPQATIQQDTKVRSAGASLAEFLSQLDDYTPTVSCYFTMKALTYKINCTLI